MITVYDQERLSFGEAYASAARIAHLLVRDYEVGRGDRVAISMRNYPEWMLAFTAITSIGAVAVAVNALWSAEELAYGLADCDAKLVFADAERIERLHQHPPPSRLQVVAVRCAAPAGAIALDELLAGLGDAAMPGVEIAPDDFATIFYTSGSSGHPKGVVSTHRNIVSALLSWELDRRIGELVAGIEPPPPAEPPGTLLAVPLFHVTGSHAVYLASYRAQRRLVSMFRWDAEAAARLIERERLTSFVAPAAMTGDLVPVARAGGHDLSSLQLVGGGVIRPARSILSAVEGSALIPGLEDLSQRTMVIVAAFIAIVLFSVQKKGTDKVSGAFGPIMTVWFAALAASGVGAILDAPHVLAALSPHYAVWFFADHGLAGILVLSQVILCATGGEALYADMGHLGRKPILRAWYFVFFAVLVNYLGQGAFLITHPGAKNILYEMVVHQVSVLYVPFLLLSIIATVIASQAMISGLFSIVYQGIMTNILPLFKVQYTSTELRSQIYIGFVNWFLLISVLFIMAEFGETHRLAAAYGLAVNVDMILTGGLMTWIFLLRMKPSDRLGSALFPGVRTVCATRAGEESRGAAGVQ